MTPRRRVISISASEFSTLVLSLPPIVAAAGEASSLASLPVNTVYGWGHGNHSVMRAIFPGGAYVAGAGRLGAGGHGSETDHGGHAYSRAVCVNPTAIACAKYHNVAITADGRVYTWGLHSESLGIDKTGESAAVSSGRRRMSSWGNAGDWNTSEGGRRPRGADPAGSNACGSDASASNSSASSISSPQLVVGMLPSNGGGCAVAVSASESHTAIVTSDGHLFTWGTSHGNEVLGHRGVRWQPIPRKVKRVHRAVGVAAAKEHTVLLFGTTFPPLPDALVPMAPEASSDAPPRTLQDSAALEISRNVDCFNVLPIALAAHRLHCRPLTAYCNVFISKNLDGVLAVGNKRDFASFLSNQRACLSGMRMNPDKEGTFHPLLCRLANNRSWAKEGKMLLDSVKGSIAAGRRIKREHLQRPLEQSLASLERKGDQKQDVSKTDEPKGLSSSVKKPERHVIPHCKQGNISKKLFQEKSDGSTKVNKVSCIATGTPTPPKYHCRVCNVTCPDADSYTLHVNGRRHRNRLAHAEAKEEKRVAKSMMAMKQMQLMEKEEWADSRGKKALAKPKSVWGAAITPKRADETPGKGGDTMLEERRARSKSFHQILSEEEVQQQSLSVGGQGMSSTPILTKITAAKRPLQTGSSKKAAASLASTQPAPLRTHSTKKSFASNVSSSPGSSLPLSAFMKRQEKSSTDTMSSVGASWGDTPSPLSLSCSDNRSVRWGTAKPKRASIIAIKPTVRQSAGPKTRTKSFSQIQQEEEAFRSNEDSTCHIADNQWYVTQRERAASIGKIQEKERREREMEELVEEQRRIEQEIAEENARERRKREEQHGGDARKKEKTRGRNKQGQRRQTKKSKKKPGCQSDEKTKSSAGGSKASCV